MNIFDMNIYDRMQLEATKEYNKKKTADRIKRLKIEYKTASGGRRMIITKIIKELENENVKPRNKK